MNYKALWYRTYYELAINFSCVLCNLSLFESGIFMLSLINHSCRWIHDLVNSAKIRGLTRNDTYPPENYVASESSATRLKRYGYMTMTICISTQLCAIRNTV